MAVTSTDRRPCSSSATASSSPMSLYWRSGGAADQLQTSSRSRRTLTPYNSAWSMTCPFSSLPPCPPCRDPERPRAGEQDVGAGLAVGRQPAPLAGRDPAAGDERVAAVQQHRLPDVV